MTPGNGPNDWQSMRDQRREQQRQWMMQRAAWRDGHPGRHAVVGVILLIVGVAFLLANLGVFQMEEIHRYWPIILIGWGAAKALGYSRFGSGRFGHSMLWGGALMVMGGLLLARNFGYVHGDVWQMIWPVWLIFLGVAFLLRQAGWRGGPWHGGGRGGGGGWPGANPGSGPGSNPGAGGVNALNETTVFGGINRRIDSQDFEGGYISAVFGGVELDLRKANTKKDEIVIEANAVFGGIELTVPEQWRVTVQGSGIFGGYDDQTHPSPTVADQKRPHLIMTGSAVFGGVSVKN